MRTAKTARIAKAAGISKAVGIAKAAKAAVVCSVLYVIMKDTIYSLFSANTSVLILSFENREDRGKKPSEGNPDRSVRGKLALRRIRPVNIQGGRFIVI